jgi:IclR family acetate operon transcriptional repressor
MPPVGRFYQLTGIDRAIAVIEAFDEGQTLSLADIARLTGLSEATTTRYLGSLTGHGIIERDPESRRYRLGLRLFELGQRALVGRDARPIAIPHMERLRERFQETVNFAARQDENLVILEVLESPRPVRQRARPGRRDSWHASSLGKAILAHLEASEARLLLESNEMTAWTSRTVIDAEVLLRQLGSVRNRGYAIDDREGTEDLRCVGAAILDHRGMPSYAISISGPSNRFSRSLVAEMGAEVDRSARAISRAIGFLGRTDVTAQTA